MEWNRAPDSTPDPELVAEGLWLGRVGRYGIGPSVVVVHQGEVFEVTSRRAPTVRDVLEQADPRDYLRDARRVRVGGVDDLGASLTWLAPCDLQVLRGAGGAFPETVIAEVALAQAGGDMAKAVGLRDELGTALRGDLAALRDGRPFRDVRAGLEARGFWTPALAAALSCGGTVPRGAVLSASGQGSEIALPADGRPVVSEPELVLAVNSRGEALGATLGISVTAGGAGARSERAAVAGCAIGPMIRLFDDVFTLAGLRAAELRIDIAGPPEFRWSAQFPLAEQLCDPLEQVTDALSAARGYPDGLMLFTGTPYVPWHPRPGCGPEFEHRPGDRVRVSCPGLGALEIGLAEAAACPPWRSGIAALMRNLAARELL